MLLDQRVHGELRTNAIKLLLQELQSFGEEVAPILDFDNTIVMQLPLRTDPFVRIEDFCLVKPVEKFTDIIRMTVGYAHPTGRSSRISCSSLSSNIFALRPATGSFSSFSSAIGPSGRVSGRERDIFMQTVWVLI
jgi:hypothetical protein